MIYSNKVRKQLWLDYHIYGRSVCYLSKPSKFKRFMYSLIGKKAPNIVKRINPRDVRYET